jgi:hypothetical protein
MSTRLIAGCLLLISCCINTLEAADARAPKGKYYALHQLRIGALLITNVQIGVDRSLKTEFANTEKAHLTLQRGVVHLRDLAQPESANDLLRADIAEGVAQDPAGALSGSFTWASDQLTGCTLDSFRIRLKHVSINTPVYGGTVVLSPADRSFLNGRGTITSGPSAAEGYLTLSTFNSQLTEADINIGGAKFSPVIRSGPGAVGLFGFDIATGRLSIDRASFRTNATTSNTPISAELISGEKVSASAMELEHLEVSFDNGSARLTASVARIQNPTMHLTAHADKEVVAIQQYVVEGLSATTSSGGLATKGLIFDAITAKTTRLAPDPWGVINQLNSLNVFAPDVLLPTGNSDVRYISPSNLGRLYEAIAAAEPTNSITRVIIKQQNGLVTGVAWDRVPVPVTDGMVEHWPCVLLEQVTDYAAAAATMAMLTMAAKTKPGAAVLGAYLTAWALSPVFGEPAALVAGYASKGLRHWATAPIVEKTVNGLLWGIVPGLGSIPGGMAGDYCELFISRLPQTIVLNRPNYVLRPKLFESLATNPDSFLADEFVARYRLYLGTTVRATTVQHDFGSQSDLSPQRAFLASVVDQQRQVANQVRGLTAQQIADEKSLEAKHNEQQSALRAKNEETMNKVAESQKKFDKAKHDAEQALENGLNKSTTDAAVPPNTPVVVVDTLVSPSDQKKKPDDGKVPQSTKKKNL